MNKRILVIALGVIGASLMISSCSSKKQVVLNEDNYQFKPKSGSPFGEVYDIPCGELDTEEEFAATGIAQGAKNRMDVLQTSALTNAQNIIRQKMQHAYKGAIDDYSNYIGNDKGTDMDAKVERAGTQVINQIVNDTRAVCGPKFSGVDEKGDVSCFVGIRISKKKIVDAISKTLSNDEELKIRFNEQEFRKRMEKSFENFKENN